MKKVVIIDDNALSAEGIAQNICWDKMGVSLAGIYYDGQSVLEQIDEIQPDIIISDIKMPGISGLEMTRAILAKYINMKIILVSAYNDFHSAREALRAGAYDYVEKPVDYEYLAKLVSDAVIQIEREQYHLESIKRSRPAIVENFFYNLTHSFPGDAQYYLKDYIPYLGINLSGSYYQSIVINIENSDSLKQSYGFEKYYVYQMSLQDEVFDAFKEYSLLHILLKHNRLILILGIDAASEPAAVQRVSDSIELLTSRHEHRILNYNIGIGDMVYDIWHIQQSYENAKQALEYRFFFTQKTIFDIRDCINKTPLNNTWSTADEEHLIRLLCKKDSEGIFQYTRRLSELFSGLTDKRKVFVILYSISNRILKFLYDIDSMNEEIHQQVISVYQNMDQYQTGDDICQVLFQLCVKICSHMTQSMESYYQQICHSVLDFIKHNYTNPDLGLNELALHINISKAHLSSIFKTETGLSISDAITNARIEAAKLLLHNSKLTIKEISEKVGYANQYYFSACFKKKTDMTPSTYRMAYDILK